MAVKRKKAPLEGPHGVDSWTSNGYGLNVGKPSKEHQKRIDEVNKELAKKKKKGK